MRKSELCAGGPQDYRNVIYRSAFCWAAPFKLCPSNSPRKAAMTLRLHSLLLVVTALGFGSALAQSAAPSRSSRALPAVAAGNGSSICARTASRSRQSRRKRHPGDQKEAGDARSTGLLPYRHDRRLRRRRACSRIRHQAPAQGQTQGVGSGRALDASRLARYGKCHASALPNAVGASRRYEQSIRPTLACPEKRSVIRTGGLNAYALARHQQCHLRSPAG
jgi:hypothetical protein